MYRSSKSHPSGASTEENINEKLVSLEKLRNVTNVKKVVVIILVYL